MQNQWKIKDRKRFVWETSLAGCMIDACSMHSAHKKVGVIDHFTHAMWAFFCVYCKTVHSQQYVSVKSCCESPFCTGAAPWPDESEKNMCWKTWKIEKNQTKTRNRHANYRKIVVFFYISTVIHGVFVLGTAWNRFWWANKHALMDIYWRMSDSRYFRTFYIRHIRLYMQCLVFCCAFCELQHSKHRCACFLNIKQAYLFVGFFSSLLMNNLCV